MTTTTRYPDDGPIPPEDMARCRRIFLLSRGMPEPRRSHHYDRLARELRNAVERITDDTELAQFIAGMKLTSKDIELMVATLSMHADHFIALNRLTEGYLNQLKPPRQSFPMFASILVHDPDNVEEVLAELTENGLDARIQEDRIDECGPTVFIEARGISDLGLGDDGFFSWVKDLVEDIGGDVEEAGYADEERPAPTGSDSNVVPLGGGS
jgi:hypothetical protein